VVGAFEGTLHLRSHRSVKLLRKDGAHHRWIPIPAAHSLIADGTAAAIDPSDISKGVVMDPEGTRPTSPSKNICDHAATVGPSRFAVCEVCSFGRAIERAHIIPESLGGPRTDDNLLDLCPNCHTLFDRFQLDWSEMAKVWPKVRAQIVSSKADKRAEAWRGKMLAVYGHRFNFQLDAD
jgi:HNH endonuclease